MPDAGGTPTLPESAPLVLRASYIPFGSLESQLSIARAELTNSRCGLFGVVECPEGPPYRSGFFFTFQEEISGMFWRDETRSHSGAQMRRFSVVTNSGSWGWLTDARRGVPGYLLTGDAKDASLWRVFRLESDALNRTFFTLAPVRFAGRTVTADFSSIHESLLASEIKMQYQDLCKSVIQHAYRDVVTKARNIVEALVADRLRMQGQGASGRLFDDLQLVRKLLESDSTRDSCGWTDLEYHLCHKIRLLHARTHPSQVQAAATALLPEFALSVIEDLNELLRAWGFCG